MISIVPNPGHKEDAVSLYDNQTKWLLTGDMVYPGRLYVREWADYVTSVAKMVQFIFRKEVVAVLSAHIEQSADNTEFELGAKYQPDEAS